MAVDKRVGTTRAYDQVTMQCASEGALLSRCLVSKISHIAMARLHSWFFTIVYAPWDASSTLP